MIRRGFALAGRTDGQLIRGVVFKILDAFFQGAPIGFLYLALRELFSETPDASRLVWLVVGIGGCLILQGLAFYRSTLDVFLSTYSLMADMRLRMGEHLRRLPMGFFFRPAVRRPERRPHAGCRPGRRGFYPHLRPADSHAGPAHLRRGDSGVDGLAHGPGQPGHASAGHSGPDGGPVPGPAQRRKARPGSGRCHLAADRVCPGHGLC